MAVTFADDYYSNINMQNIELASLVGQIEKKMNLIENSLEEVKDSLGDIKSILENI